MVYSIILSLGVVGSMGIYGVNGVPLPSLDVQRAVEALHYKQGLDGMSSEYEEGYCRELLHMLDKRLTLLEPEESERVIRDRSIKVVPLRMLLEPKKDGRKKGRLG